MMREVSLINGEPSLRIVSSSVEACIHCLDELDKFPVEDGSIEVAFVNVSDCCQLHADFFNDPDPTDVMTFPGYPEDNHAGDIAICPHVAAEACREEGTTFREELTLYLVHAYLHLSGLRDDTDPERAQMRLAEEVAMARLSETNSLLECDWAI